MSRLSGCHTFRHLATHLLERGQKIRTIQELIGGSDLYTTTVYTHVLKLDPMGVIGPADHLWQPPQVDTGSDNHCSTWSLLPEIVCGCKAWHSIAGVVLGKQRRRHGGSRKPPMLR